MGQHFESQLNTVRPYKVVLISVSFILLFSSQITLSVFGYPSIKDLNLAVELVVSGLKSPTSMIFLAKGDLLVLEKDGIV